MPIIRPITDLRNHSNEISELCKRQNEPIFITKNGRGEFVVMSQDHFDRIQTRLDLYDKLGAAQAGGRGSKTCIASNRDGRAPSTHP